MRAEREAVQEAVDNVWVMTVRCIEELRALQVMAKASLTQTVIDNISQRLEPLRSQLDDLVKNTSDNVFDGALEQAAELERNLRAVLDELDQARIQDVHNYRYVNYKGILIFFQLVCCRLYWQKKLLDWRKS